MKFSEIYQKYGALRKPTYTLKVDGRQLKSGDDARLRLLECELTLHRQAGALFIAGELTPDKEQSAAWLEALQLGAVCSLALGYQGKETEVFSGFVYDLVWDDPLDGAVLGLEAICLDARGQLMLSSCADAGAERTLSQMVRSILDQPGCTRMASSRTLGAVPKDWDLPVRRSGHTDFSVLCTAADFLCFEFYTFAHELYFGPGRPQSTPCVVFDGPNGLMSLRRRRSLAGQCAAAAVSGTDDKGERLYARRAREKDGGFGADKIKSALTGDLHQPEPAVRTMAQAKYLAKARMEERQRRGGALLGRGAGVPELRPGRFIQANGMSRTINGTYYVHTVRHTMDETGYETYFEAED